MMKRTVLFITSCALLCSLMMTAEASEWKIKSERAYLAESNNIEVIEPKALNMETENNESITIILDNEDDIESFQLSLLHEGEFPKKKEFSLNLNDESENIRRALFLKEDSIEIETSIESKELADLYEWTVNSEPELFYVKNTIEIRKAENKYIIYPQYEMDLELFKFDDSSEFKEEVDNILSSVSDEMSDIEKALAVHDYFARNYEYDYTYENSDIEEIFSEKKGVCQAYSDAYTYIMQKKLGIECYTLSSRNLNHAWNVIKIDGEWYHVDVTWDDPTFNGNDYFGAVRHQYFLISSDTIRDDIHRHNSHDWEVSGYSSWKYDLDVPDEVEEPTSERFDNYVWTNTGYSPFIYYNKNWYYIDDGDLYSFDFKTNKSTMLLPMDYGTDYDVFDIYQNTVIYKNYRDDEVCLFPMNGKGYRVLGDLYGAYSFRTNNDVLQYVVYTGNTPKFYEIKLSDIVFNVPKPVCTVNFGTNIKITLNSEISGETFYYTTDGSVPSTASKSGNQISVSKSGNYRVKVIAVKNGYNNSDIKTILICNGKQVSVGDAVNDGYINSKDVIKLNQYLAKWNVEMNGIENYAADIIDDGYINSKDIIKLNQYLAKWDVDLE